MILTNLGNGNIDCGKCLLNYAPQDLMDFKVSSSDGQKLEGTIKGNSYVRVYASGQGTLDRRDGLTWFLKSSNCHRHNLARRSCVNDPRLPDGAE